MYFANIGNDPDLIPNLYKNNISSPLENKESEE